MLFRQIRKGDLCSLDINKCHTAQLQRKNLTQKGLIFVKYDMEHGEAFYAKEH